MQALLLGLLLLVGILLVGRVYVRADPARMARLTKRVGGAAALMVAAGLLFTGRVMFALPLAAFGMWLLGKRFPFWPGPDLDDILTQGGRRSSVRTPMLEMRLDHDTGTTEGEVLAGRFAGRLLSQLSREELFSLLQECAQRDAEGAQLLRAYIERLGYRADQGGAGTGPEGRMNGMSVDEAYEVLGLKRGASPDEIQQAHRTLMKKNHPDQGGSTYLASKINEAKDVLLPQG